MSGKVSVISRLAERQRFSPDFSEVRMKEHIPVFVYGTLKQYMSNHKVLNGSPLLSRGHIQSFSNDKDPICMYDVGHFPVLGRPKQWGMEEKLEKTKSIEGEIYLVNAITLHDLDRLEGNGYMYQREKLKVSVFNKGDDGKTRVSRVECWVYLGMENGFDPKWLKPVKPYDESNYVERLDWYPNKAP
jgi:gamma-glutamylcyclotransferase (GGCT)/AIG2-like uncharacterized protein YtfP